MISCRSRVRVGLGCLTFLVFASLCYGTSAISGRVTLENWDATPVGQPVTVEIQVPGSPIHSVQTTTVTIDDSTGHYAVPLLVQLDPGTYNVALKGKNWLRGLVTSVQVPGGTADFDLTDGDCDGNNHVGLTDLSTVLADFGGPPSNVVGYADLNGDNWVDLADLSTVLANYSQYGAPSATDQPAAPTLEGLSGNARNALFIDVGVESYPFTTYDIYRKVGTGDYALAGQTSARIWVDKTGITNGTTYTYKATVLDGSATQGPESQEVALSPSADNPVAEADIPAGPTAVQQDLAVSLTNWSTGIEAVGLSVDGVYVAMTSVRSPQVVWASEGGRNGLRSAIAVVTNSDENGDPRYGFSDVGLLDVENYFSSAGVTNNSITPEDGESTTVFGRQQQDATCEVWIYRETDGQVIRTLSCPPGLAIAATWDGKDASHVIVPDCAYRAEIRKASSPSKISKPWPIYKTTATTSDCSAVVIVGAGDNRDFRSAQVNAAVKALTTGAMQGTRVKVFAPGNRARYTDDNKGISDFLRAPNCRALYYTGHGWFVATWQLEDKSWQRVYKTFFVLEEDLPGARVWPKALKNAEPLVAANRDGNYPAQRFKYYISDLGLHNKTRVDNKQQFYLVYLSCCGSGRRGALDIANNSDIKHQDSWQRIRLDTPNDMAREFGITEPLLENWQGPGATKSSYYMGYYGLSYPNQNYLVTTQEFWSKLATGATPGQVVTHLWQNVPLSKSDFAGPPYLNWGDIEQTFALTVCPPYYNLRIFADTQDYRYYTPYYDGLIITDLKH